jgi:hypothetical protein
VFYKVNGANRSFSELMGLPASQLDITYWLPWYNNKTLDTQLRIAKVTDIDANIQVTIGDMDMCSFPLAAGTSTRKSFAGIDKGPVKIESDVDIVVSERVIYKVSNVHSSFSEMMALPANQVDNVYWLPWYNSKTLDTQLRIANVSGAEASVSVSIGGAEVTGSPFSIPMGTSKRLTFPKIDTGPVKIESNVDIVAAERVYYKSTAGALLSYSETMALPEKLLGTVYWLPWYNSKTLDSQIRIANVSGADASVHVYVGGTEVTGSPFDILMGTSQRLTFLDLDRGPVKIESNVNIVAAERVIYKINNVPTSFSELMGLPNSLLDTTFWLPWYNSKHMDTRLQFGVP